MFFRFGKLSLLEERVPDLGVPNRPVSLRFPWRAGRHGPVGCLWIDVFSSHPVPEK
jgi:hypothetical protein